jgi:phenylacetate-CoA ligase
MDLKKLTESLPYPIRQSFFYAYGAIPFPIRNGRTFRETYTLLERSEWWSQEDLEVYQLRQLKRLLDHAYENVPYYRRVFYERGLKPADIQDYDDLRLLPYLTKEVVKNNLKDLIARNYPRHKLHYITTGGSTAAPMGLYWERSIVGATNAKEWAFLIKLWNRVGFRIGHRCVVLRGNVVKSASKAKFWEYDPINKNLIMSSFHMTDEHLQKYIKKIREFKPDFIQAYPSVIAILSRFMKENSIEPFSTVKAVLCSSESLYPVQRELIENVMKCRALSFYGHAERAVLAGECEKSNYYHVQPEYGIAEVIGKDGSIATEEGQKGEIIATGFSNFIMPFIRYRTMDIGVHTNKKCECGRQYPLLEKVEGRLQDFIVDKNGNLISLGPAIFGIHESEWTKVRKIQFFQEEKGELIIRVVKGANYDRRKAEEYVLKLFNLRLKNVCKLSVEFVSDIHRTERGKYRFLIQKLPITF